ncbi:hypothetical protein [Olleya aquimaris]|uniref:Cytochrome c domain-containing protein n=1 Tax=Olleya aquimaris TaxID=639310 RepID=A0A327RN04_9FLAO|nr:hypothetical protein [Olleya aquimaris]RAJ16913.1 hypothetical protein LY08_00689 [Olleya aquimaris]
MKKITYLITIISLTFFSCSNNSEDDLIDNTPLPEGQKVTYTADIKTIIDNNCISCHSNPPVNGASNSLVTYQDVSNQANTVLNRISLQSGEGGAMPLGGPRLPQASIDLFQQWIEDGLLEN